MGNFYIRYQYPDYTGLPAKIEEGSGHVEALAGSEVRIQMAANKPIARGQLVFDDNTQLPLLVRLMVFYKRQRSSPSLAGIASRCKMRWASPIRISSPIASMSSLTRCRRSTSWRPNPTWRSKRGGSSSWSTRRATILVVRELALVYRAGPFGEKRVVIDRVDEAARRYQGRYFWDVTDLFGAAGESVTYYVEVWDNDTVSGPKRGVSATHVLRIKSREEEHHRLDEMQQQVAEKLVDLLADQLELNARTADLAQEPMPRDPTAAQELAARQAELQQQAQDLVSQLDQMLQLLERDYLSDYTRYEDTRTLRENLNFTQDTLMGDARRQLSPPSGQPQSPSSSSRSPQRLERSRPKPTRHRSTGRWPSKRRPNRSWSAWPCLPRTSASVPRCAMWKTWRSAWHARKKTCWMR